MFKAPSDIYGINLFRLFMDEFGGPTKVHKYLGVSERTVWNWLSKGKVPRTAVLALFWESKYGHSQIFTDQVNEIRWLYRRVCLLQEQYTKAKDIVSGLKRLNYGSENEPVFDELQNLRDLPHEKYGESFTNAEIEIAKRKRPEALKISTEFVVGNTVVSPRAKVASEKFNAHRSIVSQRKKG